MRRAWHRILPKSGGTERGEGERRQAVRLRPRPGEEGRVESINNQIFVQRTKRTQGRGGEQHSCLSRQRMPSSLTPQVHRSHRGSLGRCFAIVASPGHLADCGESRRQLSSAGLVLYGEAVGAGRRWASPPRKTDFHIRRPHARPRPCRIGPLGPVTLRARPMRLGTGGAEGLASQRATRHIGPTIGGCVPGPGNRPQQTCGLAAVAGLQTGSITNGTTIAMWKGRNERQGPQAAQDPCETVRVGKKTRSFGFCAATPASLRQNVVPSGQSPSGRTLAAEDPCRQQGPSLPVAHAVLAS